MEDSELEKIEDVHDVDLKDDSVIIFDMETQISRDQVEHFKDQLEETGLDRDKMIIISGLDNLFELTVRGDEDVQE